VKTQRIGLHILRAVSSTGAWYCLFVAMVMMPLTNAILLTFSAPLWMPVIAWVLFREKASRATWIGAGVGFVGVLLVLQPQHHKFNFGALIALAGAFCLAIFFMCVRWLGATEPTSRILFYYFFLSTSLCTPFAIIYWRPFGQRGSTYLVGIALTLLVGQALIVLAYRCVGSQGRPVHLHRHRVHGIDRLVPVESGADAGRRFRHGPGDRRRHHRDSQEVPPLRGGRRGRRSYRELASSAATVLATRRDCTAKWPINPGRLTCRGGCENCRPVLSFSRSVPPSTRDAATSALSINSGRMRRSQASGEARGGHLPLPAPRSPLPRHA
jgi:hypothetical protein